MIELPKCQPCCDWNNFTINIFGLNGFEAICTVCDHHYDIDTIGSEHRLFLTLMHRMWELEAMQKEED